MEKAERVRVSRVVIVIGVGLLALGSASVARAKERKPRDDAPSASKVKPPPGESINACGCYRDAKGGCVCTDKKAKCECPGDCEPLGCGEKRDKEMEREMQIEIKRAEDDEKKRKQALEAQEHGAATPDGGDDGPAAPAPAKPKSKTSSKTSPKTSTKTPGKSETRPEQP